MQIFSHGHDLDRPQPERRLRQNRVLVQLLTVIWLTSCWVCAPFVVQAEILIHNSTNLSSTKWGVNGWGVAGGKYGEFVCSTCHGRKTGNIKRVKSTLTAPDADPFPIESDSGTVVFLDMREGSSDFGDDSLGHATSGKICEGCHSLNKYHNYNTANNTDGLNHENVKDCITCHKHANAFAASCTDCHGNPPSTNAHLIHAGNGAGEYSFTCDTCHPVDHDGATTDITFSGIAANWGSESYSVAPKQCSNLYCHGSATADWDGGTGGACGDCHGDVNGRPDGIDEPAGGNHLTGSHLVACSNCHSHDGGDTVEHVNGDVGHTGGDALVSSAGTNVTGYIYGATLASSPDPDGYKYSGGTCANSCHGVLDWGGTATCVTCHNGSGSGYSLVNADSPHSITATGMTCEDCHFTAHASRTTGTVEITWFASTMGVDYTVDGKIYIKSNGAGTEAESCWGCHEGQTPDVSEWDGSTATYNYGTVTDNDLNWFTTSWASANFSYKNGVLDTPPGAQTSASTHGTKGGATGVDVPGEVGCTYCHDVHGINNNGTSTTSAPYLRGSWMSNPFPEDGAPQTTAHATVWGGVPRAGLGTELATTPSAIGGWQIEQNNSGVYPRGTAYANYAGLCQKCHTETDIESAWASHAFVVDGFNDGGGSNLFSTTKRGGSGLAEGTTSARAYMMHNNTTQSTNSSKTEWLYGLRNTVGSVIKSPYVGMDPVVPISNPLRAKVQNTWGITVDANSVDPNFHEFPCSKCHNPHASRLPKLLITNCLDVANNAWDNSIDPSSWGGGAVHGYTAQQMAYSSTAANCHRYVKGTDGSRETNGSAENGWNSVSPW